MTVGPLGEGDAAALVRSMTDGNEVDDVVAACGGNPLYLIESVRDAGTDPSGGVAALVADRLDVLDEAAREIADWAAVLGHAFPATLTAVVTGGCR